MPAPLVIADVVERFEQQGDAYKSGKYNETQLRREFVDPMFKALGWDMENVSGYAEAYKAVIHEDAIKIGDATKAPDYCFRIGGTHKFFSKPRNPQSISRRMLIRRINFAGTPGRRNSHSASSPISRSCRLRLPSRTSVE
jgi:hypothetical protein